MILSTPMVRILLLVHHKRNNIVVICGLSLDKKVQNIKYEVDTQKTSDEHFVESLYRKTDSLEECN